MNAYYILIFLSVIIIFSYVFDIFSRLSKIPSVLLLLVVGILLRQGALYFNLQIVSPRVVLELFGIIGLILIVLEGALDLHLTKDKIPVIRKSFGAACLILLVSAVLIAYLINHFHPDVPFQTCLINAVPFAVISSAIAIPSVSNLAKAKKEFIVYESTFSDILGIMLFNFALQEDFGRSFSLVTFSIDSIAIVVVSVLCSMILIFFMDRITHHVKFFLIMAFLVLIYSIAKSFHLSSLLLVLVFGLMVNNADLFFKGRWSKLIKVQKLTEDLNQFKQITAESAFLIRTFFFILFGYSFNLESLFDVELLLISSLIITILTVVRFIYLKFIARTSLIPELFIAPKGLITILLFYSIPKEHLITNFSEGILFFAIIMTGLIMLIGLLFTKTDKEAYIQQ